MGCSKKLVESLRALQAKAKRQGLDDAEKASFDALRSDLARALVAAQLTVGPGQTYREALRVAHLLKVELAGDALQERTITVNLSVGGFAAMLSSACATRQTFRFIMHTPHEPLSGQARLVSLTQRGSVFVASFSIDQMSEQHKERLEMVIVDAVLAQLRI